MGTINQPKFFTIKAYATDQGAIEFQVFFHCFSLKNDFYFYV